MMLKPGSFALLLTGVTIALSAQEERVQTSTSLAVATERVQVDFVLRDKKGAILRGLSPSEVEVYEDGVRQEIASLDFIDRATAEAATVDPGQLAPGPHTTVAVAFDRLSPGARSFAVQAVLESLDKALPRGSRIGVFSIDRGLTTLQPFTDDREVLSRSVDSMRSKLSTSSSGLRERNAIRNAYAGLAEGIGQAHVAPAELSGVPECRGSEDDVVRRQGILESQLLEAFDSLERDEQGAATTHALLALIGGLQTLPGRKAIVLLSEGLVIPSDVEASFRSVVAAANRANVSIYAADAGGLRAASVSHETRRTIDTLQARLRPPGTASAAVRGPTSIDQATSGLALLEKNEDALHYAPESGLSQLADATGGFLIRDTNDLGPGLQEIDEELGAYYVLSYTPGNQDYDGRFRAITVRVKRPHGRLQSRKGYLALKTPLPFPALDHEIPALARLEAGPLPTAVPLRLRGLQFPEEPPLSLVPIMVEVPSQGLRFATDEKAGVFRQDFTVLVLVRDASRRVVAKMSQRYPLSGSLDRLDAARQGDVLFYRETRLAPGSYTLEAIAYDALADAAGATSSTLEVPVAASGQLRASSLMVVRSAERRDPTEGAAPKALEYGDVVLYPNLGQPLRRETGGAVAFFVKAWPAIDRPGIDARVEVLRSGRTIVTTKPSHLLPDALGRIQLASSLPLERLGPGAYELRVTLTDGRDAETRTAAFPIAP
jgi:VWFA-related protein